MSRFRIAVIVAMLFSTAESLRAQSDQPMPESVLAAPSYPETWPADIESISDGEWAPDEFQQQPAALATPEMPVAENYPHAPALPGQFEYEEDVEEWPAFWPRPSWFGLRHSSTHGRHMGRGQPFAKTSWQNRPWYVGVELGPMWFTQSIYDNVSTDTDFYGGILGGWDWDHYWGTELRFNWATPEFRNSDAPNADRTDSMFTWNMNLMYYPWGDAKMRPYWRAGVGTSHFDYPIEDGTREDADLLTIPVGLGFKYPFRRWLAGRAEIADLISVGSDHPTQHNVALTFGLEWRFGSHPRSYWPYHPHKHHW